MECTVSWTGATGARSGMGFLAETGTVDGTAPRKAMGYRMADSMATMDLL